MPSPVRPGKPPERPPPRNPPSYSRRSPNGSPPSPPMPRPPVAVQAHLRTCAPAWKDAERQPLHQRTCASARKDGQHVPHLPVEPRDAVHYPPLRNQTGSHALLPPVELSPPAPFQASVGACHAHGVVEESSSDSAPVDYLPVEPADPSVGASHTRPSAAPGPDAAIPPPLTYGPMDTTMPGSQRNTVAAPSLVEPGLRNDGTPSDSPCLLNPGLWTVPPQAARGHRLPQMVTPCTALPRRTPAPAKLANQSYAACAGQTVHHPALAKSSPCSSASSSPADVSTTRTDRTPGDTPSLLSDETPSNAKARRKARRPPPLLKTPVNCCGRTFSTRKELKSHRRWHKRGSPRLEGKPAPPPAQGPPFITSPASSLDAASNSAPTSSQAQCSTDAPMPVLTTPPEESPIGHRTRHMMEKKASRRRSPHIPLSPVVVIHEMPEQPSPPSQPSWTPPTSTHYTDGMDAASAVVSPQLPTASPPSTWLSSFGQLWTGLSPSYRLVHLGIRLTAACERQCSCLYRLSPAFLSTC